MADDDPVMLSTPRPSALPEPEPVPREPGPLRVVAGVLWRALRVVARGVWSAVRRVPPRTRLVVLCSTAAVVVVCGGGFVVVQRVAFSPREPVEELAAAFGRGDVAAAARLSGCSARLCQAGALGTGYTPPAGFRVVEVVSGSITGREAFVRVRYRLGEAERTSVVRVRRDHPGRNWVIADGVAGYLEVVARSVGSARVAGGAVPTVRSRRQGAAARAEAARALIGVYTVGADDAEALFTAAPVSVPVAGGRDGSVAVVELAESVKPAAADEVGRQVREFVDQCAGVGEFVPRIGRRRCPFGYPKVLYKPADPVWRVDRQPGIELRMAAATGSAAAAVTVHTVAQGLATLSYTSDGVPVTVPVEFGVDGAVTVDKGTVTWSG